VLCRAYLRLAVLGADCMAAVSGRLVRKRIGLTVRAASRSLWGAGSDQRYGAVVLSGTMAPWWVVPAIVLQGRRVVGLTWFPLAHAGGEQQCESMCVWRFLVGIMVSGVGACWLVWLGCEGLMAHAVGWYGAGLADSYKSPECLGMFWWSAALRAGCSVEMTQFRLAVREAHYGP